MSTFIMYFKDIVHLEASAKKISFQRSAFLFETQAQLPLSDDH